MSREIIVYGSDQSSLTTTSDNTVLVFPEAEAAIVQTGWEGPEGDQGDQGPPGPAVGAPVFIQSTQPTVTELAGATSYAWCDTSNPSAPSLLFEDGT